MKRTLLGVMGLLLALLVWSVPGVPAATIDDYSGAWQQNAPGAELYFNYTDTSNLTDYNSVELYLFDLTTKDELFVLNIKQPLSMSVISVAFNTTANSWEATNFSSFSTPLTLTDRTFGFLFRATRGSTVLNFPEYTISYNENVLNTPFTIQALLPNNAAVEVSISNANPVPLPGTLALLFPCILGILGLGWRKNRAV